MDSIPWIPIVLAHGCVYQNCAQLSRTVTNHSGKIRKGCYSEHLRAAFIATVSLKGVATPTGHGAMVMLNTWDPVKEHLSKYETFAVAILMTEW